MVNVMKSVGTFVAVAFLLLGVLFGMQIMTFIFGNLSQVDALADVSLATTNESAYVNITGYTISEASRSNYTGSSATAVWANTTAGWTPYLLPSANYTLDSATGVLTNATIVPNVTEYNTASISYTSSHKTEAEIATESTSNNTLQAIVTYTEQSNTQFNTVAIAITLIVLIAVFLLFWAIFIKGKGKKKGTAGGNFA